MDFSLGPSEVMLLQVEDVERMEFPSIGAKSKRTPRGQSGNLILTNERIVFSWRTGVFRKETHLESFPLQDVKVYKDVAQVKAFRPYTEGAPYPVHVFFTQEQVEFQFPEHRKSSIQPWIETINEEIVGVKQGFDPADIATDGVLSKIAQVAKSMVVPKDVAVAKPSYSSITCPNCNGVNRVLEGSVSECQFCGSPLEAPVGDCSKSACEDSSEKKGISGIADAAAGALDVASRFLGR